MRGECHSIFTARLTNPGLGLLAQLSQLPMHLPRIVLQADRLPVGIGEPLRHTLMLLSVTLMSLFFCNGRKPTSLQAPVGCRLVGFPSASASPCATHSHHLPVHAG